MFKNCAHVDELEYKLSSSTISIVPASNHAKFQ